MNGWMDGWEVERVWVPVPDLTMVVSL